MKSLFFSYDMDVSKAYIIRVKGHILSEEKAKQCSESCDAVGMPWEHWDAYNGIDGEIVKPNHHSQVMDMVKVTDHYLTRGEVACALSHISLWAKCVQEDKPLVVLEHDAIMVEPYHQHGVFNSICYLGGSEQVFDGWSVLPTPPHGSDGPNNHFICRAHAYGIDPAVAKNMVAHVIKYGINAPLDIMLRADIFPIHQIGLFAYNAIDGDAKGETTILNRPKDGRTTKRNDNLES